MNFFASARLLALSLQVTVFSLLLITGDSASAGQQPQFKGMLRTETNDRPPMEIPFWASAEQLRMDVSQPLKMTVVWSFGPEPSMRMIRHDEKVYVEWGPKMLENARQMVRRANQGTETPQVDTLRFEATGARATLDEWETFEVRLLPTEKEPGGRLWLTQDADYGLVEFFSHYARALRETTQFPMIGTDNDSLGLNNGTNLPLDQLNNATGLNGRVVRIIDDGQHHEPAQPTTITLHSLESGPIPEDMFTVPDGYVRKSKLLSGVN